MIFLEEEERRNIVFFYVIYTCIYFPILLCLLVWSKGINIVGEYSFQSFLLMIFVAETAKYFASTIHSQRRDYNLARRQERSLWSVTCRMIFNKSKLKEGIKTLVIVTLMGFIYFLLAILFGAEFFDKHEQTIMFSSLLTILTIFPACLNLGPQSILPLILGIKPVNVIETLMTQNLYFSIGGAWAGAICIPLDWDRPWQEWPIPCSYGAMFAFLLSHVIMLYRLKGRNPKKHK